MQPRKAPRAVMVTKAPRLSCAPGTAGGGGRARRARCAVRVARAIGYLNAGTVDPAGTIPIANRVPFQGFGPGMLITYNGGWSSYNALTAKVERRFARGL